MIRHSMILPLGLLAATACANSASRGAGAPANALPAGSAESAARIAASPRHGEWATIRTGAGDSVRAWVVYPERRDRAPVVVVVHEIFGLSTWIRAVADQLAAQGYIAIAPDLLTGKVPLQGDTATQAAATAAIRTLKADDVQRQLAAVGAWGMQLPAARQGWATLGFCWGGSASFQAAVANPAGLKAAVVYYGAAPAPAEAAKIRVPVIGLFGGDDARVNATLPGADSTMRAIGGTFSVNIFDGAGHGFLRQQDGKAGANLAAAQKAWPLTIAFLGKHLGT